MKAYVVDKYLKKGALRLAELADPEPGKGEILVRVKATAVNLLDSKIRDGEFKIFLPYRPPFVLGHDVAGIVVGIGPGVQRFKIGDEIYARPRDHHIGTFAELIVFPEGDAAHKPSRLTMEEASSIPLVALTAWQALVDIAHVQPGQKVFIQAGSGGVGSIAIQLAKHLGATVATTTSSKNAGLVKSLGADVVIDYTSQDFEASLKDYDVVLHSQGAKELDKSLRVLKPGGHLVSISGPPDAAFAKDLGLGALLKLVVSVLSRSTRKKAKSLGVQYTFLFMRADGGQLEQIARLIHVGALRPVIDRVFPFLETPEAVAYVETGRAKGKVVISLP